MKCGIFPAPAGLEHRLDPEPRHIRDGARDSFRDGREGRDRWGRKLANKIVCGHSWEGWHCPAYVEESCPGEFNKGVRKFPDAARDCDLACGRCGGGGRAETIAATGWSKGRPIFEGVWAEMGETFRLDAHKAPGPGQIVDLPISYFPGVQWGIEKYDLHKYPMLGMTMKTATTHRHKTLRERLNGYEGHLLVNGYAKDDRIDDVWENLDAHLDYYKRSDISFLVTPQYSAYDLEPVCTWVWNAARITRFYIRGMEKGLNMVLDLPPSFPPWQFEDWMEFCRTNDVKAVGLSYQTLQMKGLLKGVHVKTARELHRELPEGCNIFAFGVTFAGAMKQLCSAFEGRKVYFTSVGPFGRSLYYRLMPSNVTASKKWSRGDVFDHNMRLTLRMADKVTARGVTVPALSKGSGPPAPSSGRRSRGAARRAPARGRPAARRR